MSRRSWLMAVGLCASAAATVLLLAYLTGGLAFTTTVGGPVGIVVGKPPTHGLIGIEFGDSTAAPLKVERVIADSGADTAGIQAGDIIEMIGSARSPDAAAVQRVAKGTKPGDQLTLTVRRGTEELELVVTLMSYADLVRLKQRAPSDTNAP